MSTPEPWEASINATIERFAQRCIDEGLTQAQADEKFRGLLDEVSSELGRLIAADQDSVLRARRDEDESFELRLWERWGAALDLYYSVFVLCQEVGGDFNGRHRPGAAEEDDFRFEALSRIHARACSVASSIYVLLRTGHASDAQARWRTLHELNVVGAVLGHSETIVSKRFLAHEAVDSYNDALVYQQRCAALGQEPFTDAELAAIKGAYDGVIAEFGNEFRKRWGWAEPLFTAAGKSRFEFETLEQIAGLDLVRPYVKWAHHWTHADSKGASYHLIDLGAGDQMLLAGPSNGGLADPGHGALISLAQVTTTYLLRGRDALDPWSFPIVAVIDKMVDDAGLAFLDAHRKLEAEEEARIAATIAERAQPATRTGRDEA